MLPDSVHNFFLATYNLNLQIELAKKVILTEKVLKKTEIGILNYKSICK